GVAQWTSDGVATCLAASDQLFPVIASDAAGGAIVTWTDYRAGVTADIYAQRLNAAGAPQWLADGVAICTAPNDQVSPRVASDGTGGAVVTWGDTRTGNSDVYAQRVDAAGSLRWSGNGVQVAAETSDQDTPAIAAVGSGAVIAAWRDF